jgi:uncharacterized membrane protein YgaE (UPF0421/DUF939 family)
METKKVYTLHEENKEWLSKLAFYKDEIKVMENRVSEIASKNTSKDILSSVEHFQNQLIIQRNSIDELAHSINDHETYLINRAKENPTAIDHRSVNDHPVMRDSFNSFEKVINELRKELNLFLTKTM